MEHRLRHRCKPASILFILLVSVFLTAAAVSAASGFDRSRTTASNAGPAVAQSAFSGSVTKALPKPSGLRITCKGLGKLYMSWNSISGASYYALFEKPPGQSTYYKVGNISGTSTYLYNNFKRGKRYYYKIRAFGSGGSSAYSNTIAIVPKEKAKKITRTISGKNVKLSLRWIPTAYSYQIARKVGSGSYKGIATVKKRTYTDTSTKRGKTYYYRYRAIYKYHGYTMYGAWSPSVKAKIPGSSGSSGSGKSVWRALLIGNGSYSYANDLNGPGKDVTAMKAMLAKRGYSKITVKKNVSTKQAFKNAIKSAFSGAKSSDVSLFFYSGHGMSDTSSSSYEGALCPTNGYYSSDMLTISELATALKKIPGKVVVLLDSCGSGGAVYSKSASGKITATTMDFDPDVFNQAVADAFSSADAVVADADEARTGELRKSKFYVITACGYQEYSYDNNGGYFTKALVEGGGFSFTGHYGLSGYMAGDSNKNNKLSLNEAANYIRKKISSWGIPQHTRAYPAKSSQVIMKK